MAIAALCRCHLRLRESSNVYAGSSAEDRKLKKRENEERMREREREREREKTREKKIVPQRRRSETRQSEIKMEFLSPKSFKQILF